MLNIIGHIEIKLLMSSADLNIHLYIIIVIIII